MKEPERWLSSRSGSERRLILAALAEVPPAAAWERAASRLGEVGVALSAPVTPTAAIAVGISKPAMAPAFFKAVLIGLGVGGVAVVGVQVGQSGEGLARAGYSLAMAPKPTEHPRAADTQTAGSTTPTTAPFHVLPQSEPVPKRQMVESSVPTTLDPEPRSLALPDVAQPDLTAREVAHPVHNNAGADPGPIVPPTASPRSLEREVAAIAAARRALKRGDATTTTKELAALDASGGFRILAQEAALLRVEALSVSGQAEGAAALARQLLATGAADAHRSRLEQLAISGRER